jgi:hypothetical protein
VARSSGSAWIEPKKGAPCRVCSRRNGKRQAPSEWFDARGPAISLRNALNAKLKAERPLIIAGQLLPLADILIRYTTQRHANGKMSDGTVAQVTDDINGIIRQTKWCTVADITAPRLKDWRAAYPKAAIGRQMRNLRALLRWCAKPENLAQPVAGDLNLFTPQTPVAVRPRPTPEQLQTILDRAAEHGQLPLVHCLMTYPWRPKSFCLVRIRDLELGDREAGTMFLRKTKNGKDLRGLLLPETVDLLRALVKGRVVDDFVFRTPWQTEWVLSKHGTAGALGKWFRGTITYDMPACAYDGKRTSLTDLVAASAGDIATVAELACISKAMVVRYLQTNEDRKRALLNTRAARAKTEGAIRGQLDAKTRKDPLFPVELVRDLTVTYSNWQH